MEQKKKLVNEAIVQMAMRVQAISQMNRVSKSENAGATKWKGQNMERRVKTALATKHFKNSCLVYERSLYHFAHQAT